MDTGIGRQVAALFGESYFFWFFTVKVPGPMMSIKAGGLVSIYFPAIALSNSEASFDPARCAQRRTSAITVTLLVGIDI